MWKPFEFYCNHVGKIQVEVLGKKGGGGLNTKHTPTSFIVQQKMNENENNSVLNIKHFRPNTTVVIVYHNLTAWQLYYC